MILPTKGISMERAMITIGADVIHALQSPATVSGLWDRLGGFDLEATEGERVSFDWFSLVLTMLYAIGAIEQMPDGRLRRSRVSP